MSDAPPPGLINLSADLGEGSPDEEHLWPLINSANVACGGHVGDDTSMREAATLAARYGVRFGAHPSYPDREHFGRRSLSIDADALEESLRAQIAALAQHGKVSHVKPHGALYNDAHRRRDLAAVIARAIAGFDRTIALVAPDHSEMAAAARAMGLPVLREAFADRRYEPDGSLTPRAIAGSTLSVDEAVAQATLLAREGRVLARDGTSLAIPFDTICIHADMDGALERARAIRAQLERA
jgi:5-oxoprolinase (ATP-hydrolysing) subunit A